MSAARDRALERIKKCLALAGSSNSHEAATALRQAQALMRQHDLTEDDLAALEMSTEMVRTREGYGNGNCLWLNQMASLMKAAFGVQAMLERNPGTADRANVTYYGIGGRPQLAAFAHRVVQRAVDEAWAEHLAVFPEHKGDGGKRQAFRTGWLIPVASKVEAIGFTDDEAAAMNRFRDRTFGDGIRESAPGKLKLSREDKVVAHFGLAAGTDFELRRPVGADADESRRLGHDG